MAIFTRDTFTLGPGETAGENLSAHTGETGATWTEAAGGTGDLLVSAAGDVYLGGATAGSYYYTEYHSSGTPAGADYTVQADLTIATLPTGHFAARILGRIADANNWYSFGYDQTSGWTLARDVGSSEFTLASTAATPAAGATHTIALVMSGSSISGQVDGVTVVGPVTDTGLSAAGTAGLAVLVDTAATYTPGAATGVLFDNVVGTDTSGYTVTASPATVTLAPGATQTFTAAVTGSTNQGVTWSVVETGGGTISSGGLYTAPSTPGTYHVRAVAAADGATSGQATVAVAAPSAPAAPVITISTASGLDTIRVSAAVAPGTNPVAGYRLYAGASSGAEADTGLTISPTTFPAAFPAQATAAPGAGKYYTVKAYDTAAPPLSSAASNEVYSRATSLVPSGTTVPRLFLAPYGSSASGLAAALGYTVYDYQGAILYPHTTGQTYELVPGDGLYAALVSIDVAYSGVLVWDAPSGSGPYAQTFDAGALAMVSGYAAGQDPASLILQSPAHKLLSTASGQVDVDWTEPVPATASGLTLGRAALAAIAEGVGVWKYDPAARTLVEYAEDGTTVLRSFALTIDGAGTITQRA